MPTPVNGQRVQSARNNLLHGSRPTPDRKRKIPITVTEFSRRTLSLDYKERTTFGNFRSWSCRPGTKE